MVEAVVADDLEALGSTVEGSTAEGIGDNSRQCGHSFHSCST